MYVNKCRSIHVFRSIVYEYVHIQRYRDECTMNIDGKYIYMYAQIYRYGYMYI